MKFWEAMREMQENGKRIRCKEWLPGHFMSLSHDNTSVDDRSDLWVSKYQEWEIFKKQINPAECVLPSCNEITFASGTMPITIEQVQPIKIAVNYPHIINQLIRRCKRTKDGTITDESLIDACMELANEQG